MNLLSINQQINNINIAEYDNLMMNIGEDIIK